MSQDSRPIYGIGAVARMLGITPSTLRTWEDRYGLVSPQRNGSGRRLYSPDEIEQLRFVKTKINEGIQPADAHRLLASRTNIGRVDVERPVQRGPRPLILIAERDPYATEFMEYFLRRDGYDVAVAADAAETETKFVGLSPQLVIIELLLSGGEGAALCRRLKDRSAVSVLVVSSLDGRDAALAAGADAFLPKPLDPLVLASAVRDMTAPSPLVESQSGAGR
jgi:DNA-binding transcriptional MerR regulator